MIGSFILFISVVGLAYLAASTSRHIHDDGKMHWNIFLVAMVILLILFNGLRTHYNDTTAYYNGFIYSDMIGDFMANSENFDVFHNPAFYFLQSFVRTYTNNPNVFFFILGIVVNVLNISFLVKYIEAKNFAFSMVIYCAMGLLMATIGAQKQVLAMAILTLALDQLIQKHHIRFFIIVYIAGLFHTYAWAYFVLPLFATKPWSLRTILLLLVTLVITTRFRLMIESFLEFADEVGKEISSESIFGTAGMNTYRALVYSIVPGLSFFFRSKINEDISRSDSIFIQMSIISFMLIIFASVEGANMFGRAAMYFTYGYVVALPVIIRTIYNSTTARSILIIATVFFCLFFLRDTNNFSSEYRRKSIYQFVYEITHPTPTNYY